MSEPIWCAVTLKTPMGWWVDDEPHPDFWAAHALIEGLLNGDWRAEQCGPGAGLIPNDPGIFWEFNGEGNYGLYDEDVAAALEWLEAHGVPYRATSDPKYDMLGEIRVFDGREVHDGTFDGLQVTLTHGEFVGIRSKWTHAPAGALSAIEGYFEKFDFDTEATAVSHLPDQPPPSEEEE